MTRVDAERWKALLKALKQRQRVVALLEASVTLGMFVRRRYRQGTGGQLRLRKFMGKPQVIFQQEGSLITSSRVTPYSLRFFSFRIVTSFEPS